VPILSFNFDEWRLVARAIRNISTVGDAFRTSEVNDQVDRRADREVSIGRDAKVCIAVERERIQRAVIRDFGTDLDYASFARRKMRRANAFPSP